MACREMDLFPSSQLSLMFRTNTNQLSTGPTECTPPPAPNPDGNFSK
jgi:hypothetical protein